MKFSKKKIITLVIILIIFLSLFVLLRIFGKNTFLKSFASDSTKPSFTITPPEPTEIIVKYKSKPSSGTKSKIFSLAGSADSQDLSVPNVTVIKNIPPQEVTNKVNRLKQDPNILYAEPNYYYSYYFIPNDPYFSQQWGLAKIEAPKAWGITLGFGFIKIAIIDAGVDVTHPDLVGKVSESWNTQDDEPKHGTHVAGIAASMTNNGIGISSISYNARLMVADVGYARGIKVSDAAMAVKWAADNGAAVINMSWGGTFDTQTLHDQIKYASSKNVILVAAAGNSSRSTLNYPAAYSEVISVAATTDKDQKASFSTFGSWVTLAAPGVNILSTTPGNNYASYSGTSMSAPFVSGLVALMKAKYPNYSPQQIKDTLCSSADKIVGTGIYWQCGRINASNALGLPQTPGPAPAPTAIPPSPTPKGTPGPVNSCKLELSPQVMNVDSKNQILTAYVTGNTKKVTKVTFTPSNTQVKVNPQSDGKSPYQTFVSWGKGKLPKTYITVSAYLEGLSSPTCQATAVVGSGN